jgi:hypothetical protein
MFAVPLGYIASRDHTVPVPRGAAIRNPLAKPEEAFRTNQRSKPYTATQATARPIFVVRASKTAFET